MGAIRLLAIVVLVYLAWRMLQNLSSRKSSAFSVENQTEPKQKFDKPEDILKEDPICGKLVPQHQAVMWQKDGKTHYFCSGECCTAFQNQQTRQSKENGEKT